MGKVLIGIIIAIVLGFTAFTWLTLHWSYSDGERAGLLQKFSRRGWICKTYEGEMVLATVATVNAEKFAFTVRDEDIAKQLIADIGQHVKVHYEQRKWIPTSCFGDTEYFVTSVRQETPEQPPAPQMQPPAPQMQPPAPQMQPQAPQMQPPAPQMQPPAPQMQPPAPQTQPPAPQ
ncbi:MAG TPA: hypothetical protein VL220_09615 [Steroidobacteraceae bacterium]|nr:hypothetical protein [Steroidobacteraceae bacterium]